MGCSESERCCLAVDPKGLAVAVVVVVPAVGCVVVLLARRMA